MKLGQKISYPNQLTHNICHHGLKSRYRYQQLFLVLILSILALVSADIIRLMSNQVPQSLI